MTLVPDEVNSPPMLRPGTANLTKTVYPVIRGKLLPVQVIGDWRDPESDSLSLEAIADGSSVDGLGRLNVVAPMKAGTQGVPYAVNDGQVGSARAPSASRCSARTTRSSSRRPSPTSCAASSASRCSSSPSATTSPAPTPPSPTPGCA